MNKYLFLLSATFLALAANSATAIPFYFSTGDPDGRIGMASRPNDGSFEIETADDFVLNQETKITSATFTGLLTGGAMTGDISSVGIEIYRVFPKDSVIGRTSGAPAFSTSQVPTRINSPSDVAFASVDSAGGLTFSVSDFGTFTASNSVQPGGIHPLPNTNTGGDGPITGNEVKFDITFTTGLDLVADHYFFVPLVGLASGDFLWLSAPKPITGGSGPFAPDLQVWTRDDFINPDWLRVGTDIVGATTFNATFSLAGDTVNSTPEPSSLLLIGLGGMVMLWTRRFKRC